MADDLNDNGPGSPPEIAELIGKSKRGDLEAFAELVRRYREKAYGLAYSFLNNHADAEDVSQEAFVKVFKSLGSFRESGSFQAWLLTIVSNLAKNKIRWKKLRERLTFSLDRSHESEEEGEGPAVQAADPDAGIDPVRQTESSLRAEMVARHLEDLPEQQRIAVRLKFIEGYKISEVAKLMGLAEGTIKAHIFRGLAKLREAMGEGVADEL